MKKDETRVLEQLGREVAAELGETDSPHQLQAQRRAVQALAGTVHPVRSRKRMLLAAGMTVGWGIVLFVLLVMLFPPAMTFWVGDQTRAGTDGTWLQAPQDNQLPVRFEDGTQVVLNRKDTCSRSFPRPHRPGPRPDRRQGGQEHPE
jgi:hypothetical protein